MDFTKQLLNKNIPFVDILVVPAEVLWGELKTVNVIVSKKSKSCFISNHRDNRSYKVAQAI